MNISLIGRTQLLYNTGIILDREGYNIKAVITAPAAPEYTRKENDFKYLSDKVGASFYCGYHLDDWRNIVEDCDIAVSVNWPTVMNQDAIALFKYGIMNAHMGDLPRYRGNACPNWAILRGENEIVLSLHLMTAGELDCGRVVARTKLPLEDETTIGDVYAWAETEIPNLFKKALLKVSTDPEYFLYIAHCNDPKAFRCYPRRPEDAKIDWHDSVEQIHRLIRASGYPFEGAYTYLLHNRSLKKLFVLRARIKSKEMVDLAVPGHVVGTDPELGEIYVACGKGIMAIQECRIGDGDKFKPGTIFKSTNIRLGLRAEDMLFVMQKLR